MKKYPYFSELYKKFRKNNKINNGGDFHRLNSFILNIEYLISEKNIPGDFAELGVWRGNTAQILAYFAKKYDRHCYLFDTFKGFHKNDLIGIDSKFTTTQFSNTSVNIVQECIGGEYLNYCTFIIGHFPNSVPANFYNKKLSIVSIDADLYEPTKAGLEYFYPLMSEGAIFFCMTTPQLFGKVAKKQLMSFVTKKNNILF